METRAAPERSSLVPFLPPLWRQEACETACGVGVLSLSIQVSGGVGPSVPRVLWLRVGEGLALVAQICLSSRSSSPFRSKWFRWLWPARLLLCSNNLSNFVFVARGWLSVFRSVLLCEDTVRWVYTVPVDCKGGGNVHRKILNDGIVGLRLLLVPPVVSIFWPTLNLGSNSSLG
ncbi:hypothetical protein Bca101_025597 [Brassica carinata]